MTLETIPFTEFSKLDMLSDPVGIPGQRIIVEGITTRSEIDSPSEASDYVWVATWSYHYESEERQNKQFTYQKLPLQNINHFFTDITRRHINPDGNRELKVAIEIKRVLMVTKQVGKDKFRACKVDIGVKAGGREIAATSEIKMDDSFLIIKQDSFSKVQGQFDPKGLNVIEYAYVDALRQAFGQLNGNKSS